MVHLRHVVDDGLPRVVHPVRVAHMKQLPHAAKVPSSHGPVQRGPPRRVLLVAGDAVARRHRGLPNNRHEPFQNACVAMGRGDHERGHARRVCQADVCPAPTKQSRQFCATHGDLADTHQRRAALCVAHVGPEDRIVQHRCVERGPHQLQLLAFLGWRRGDAGAAVGGPVKLSRRAARGCARRLRHKLAARGVVLQTHVDVLGRQARQWAQMRWMCRRRGGHVQHNICGLAQVLRVHLWLHQGRRAQRCGSRGGG